MNSKRIQDSIGIGSKVRSMLSLLVLSGMLLLSANAESIPIIPGFLPLADAGYDQTVFEDASVSLNGLNSFSFDMSTISYQWSQVSGAPVSIIGSNTAIPYFTAPQVAAAGDILTFQLVVSDGSVESDPAFVYITIQNVNRPPIANAGGGQSVPQNSLVTLNGSASIDPDADPLTYSWTQTFGPAVTLNGATTAYPTFVSPLVGLSGATLKFTLTVSDGALSNTSSEVNIIVNNPDRAPIANAGGAGGLPMVTAERAMVYLNGSGSSDPDGDLISFSWTQISGPPVLLFLGNTANPYFVAPEVTSAGAPLTFQLVVSDGILQSSPATIDVQIYNVNRVPLANAGANQTSEERALVNLDGSASTDPDGDSLDYLWTQISGPSVVLSLNNVANPNFTAPEVGPAGATLGFMLTVSDGALSANSIPIYISVTDVNRAPIADAGVDQTVNMQTLVTLNGSGTLDLDGDLINYQWTQVSGPAVVLNLADPIHPTFLAPKVALDGSIVTFSLVASDGKLSSDPAYVNVNIKNVNHAPVASAGINQIVSAGTNVVLDAVDSYDPDGDVITFLWAQVSGPLATIVGPTTMNPNFIAPNVPIGGSDLTFKVTISDGKLTASATVVITVQRVNHAPVANAGGPQTIQEKTIATLDATNSFDPDGDPLTFIWSQITGPAAVMDLTDPSRPRIIAPDITALTQLTYSLVVSDGFLNSAPSTVVVTIKPVATPPSCNLGRVEESVLWPPDHRMHEIELEDIFERDHEDDPGNKITFTSVTQDEPTSGLGDGDAPVDCTLKPKSVLVRRERQTTGSGRVYTVNYTATNARGEACVGAVKLCVPQSSKKKSCTDKGQKYQSTK